MISPTRLFERFQFTDARGLVSLQALAALSLYLGGDKNIDVATKVLTEFLHNMSLKALNDKDEVLLKFSEIRFLMDELAESFTGITHASVEYNKQVLDRVSQEINDYDVLMIFQKLKEYM